MPLMVTGYIRSQVCTRLSGVLRSVARLSATLRSQAGEAVTVALRVLRFLFAITWQKYHMEKGKRQ